jgi:molybdate transport system substrate-binding protein
MSARKYPVRAHPIRAAAQEMGTASDEGLDARLKRGERVTNMVRRILALIFCLLAAAARGDDGINVAIAANMQYAMEEIKAEYQRRNAAPINLIFASSGKLTVQIRNGAPFDIFVSADMSHPDSLIRWGLAAGPVKPYAFGKLVLWTMGSLDLSKGLKALADPSVKKIAVADSGRAPYGAQAMNALRASGLREKLAGALVFGESISQVNQYVLIGNVDAGITSKSTVAAGEMAGKGKWVEVDPALYGEIAQGAVVCRHGMDKRGRLSAEFLAFLYGEEARKILVKHGYSLP